MGTDRIRTADRSTGISLTDSHITTDDERSYRNEDVSSVNTPNTQQEETEHIIHISAEHAQNIFGQFDIYKKKIEQELSVSMILRDDQLKLRGTQEKVCRAEEVVKELARLTERGSVITEQVVDYVLHLSESHQTGQMTEIDQDIICHTIHGKPIKAKTVGQKEYIDQITQKMIVFGVGPAGTGKTYLAMAKAITAFKNNEVSRIILTRPAIEAGEKLGFLPGDLQSKVDPYLRPLYDALYEIMGADTFMKNMEKGVIEVAPLAYMRGRTLDNSFIVLDEAQNTTPAQMKMFLTRIGFGSKAVITGDLSQKDLALNVKSGLEEALYVLRNVNEIGICRLTSHDVVRHPLVQKIVTAYEDYENQKEHIKNKNSHYKK